MTDHRAVRRINGPLQAVVAVPGSKSIANRALICATLAAGTSQLSNLPLGDDTVAMLSCVSALGAGIGRDGTTCVVAGTAGVLNPGPATLHAGLAGTTSRFITALCALGSGDYVIDGFAPLRARPMGPLHDALGQLGSAVQPLETPGHLPVRLSGRARRLADPSLPPISVSLPGNVSSQYITALMLIGPYLAHGLRIALTTPLISRPYVLITKAVMASFGVDDVAVSDGVIDVWPGTYQACDYDIEPDASSASYPLAAAAICGGQVRVRGLGPSALQGDAAFADLLAEMGCVITRDETGTTVRRAGPLRGISVDMADLSDLVPTLAVTAPFATSPTTITGVGFIRAKESDRLGDLATELARCGIRAEVEPDGIVIYPGLGAGSMLDTHHDHRLAMAFAVLGLGLDGVIINDPTVVSKSWPEFWGMLEQIDIPQ